MKALVKFSFGPLHPLYNNPVEAELQPSCGYNGKSVFGKTIKPVYFQEDPNGLLVCDEKGTVVGTKSRKAFSRVVKGWVEKIWFEPENRWLTDEEFSNMCNYFNFK